MTTLNFSSVLVPLVGLVFLAIAMGIYLSMYCYIRSLRSRLHLDG